MPNEKAIVKRCSTAIVRRDNSANMKPLTEFELYLAALPIVEISRKLFHLDKARNEVRPISDPKRVLQWKA
jgi:hypothetical protein